MNRIFFGLLVMIVFTNLGCTSYKSSRSNSSQSLPPPPPQGGAQLYATHCASCHGSLATTTRRPRTFTQVWTAIQTIPQMLEISSLRALTQAQVQLISNELAATPPPPPPPSGGLALNYQQPLGNRLFIANKLKSLFSNGSATLNTLIDSMTLNRAAFFGGPCNATMTECGGDMEQNTQVSPYAKANILRSGYRTKVCEAVLDNDLAVTNLLSQVGLTSASPRSAANVGLVFEALTNASLSATVFTDLQQLSDVSGTPIMGWRLILLALCTSSLFENF